MKTFKTKVAVTEVSRIDESLDLEKLGISSPITDEDVMWLDIWIPIKNIAFVEGLPEGDFNIHLKSGNTVTAKDNPFAEEKDANL